MANSSIKPAGQLDAGRAAADDHHRQQAVVDEARVHRRHLEVAQHVLAERHGVVERLEGEAVLGHARDAVGGGGGAGGHHQAVVVDRLADVGR